MRARLAAALLLAIALALTMTPAAAFADADLAAGTIAGPVAGTTEPQADDSGLQTQASAPHVRYRTLVQSDCWQVAEIKRKTPTQPMPAGSMLKITAH